jgi:hypothetical protein
MKAKAIKKALLAGLIISFGFLSTGYAQLIEKRRATRIVCEVVDGENKEEPLRLDFEYSLAFLDSHQPSGGHAASFRWEPLPDGITVTREHLVRLEGRNFYLLKFSRENESMRGGVEDTAVLLVRGGLCELLSAGASRSA